MVYAVEGETWRGSRDHNDPLIQGTTAVFPSILFVVPCAAERNIQKITLLVLMLCYVICSNMIV